MKSKLTRIFSIILVFAVLFTANVSAFETAVISDGLAKWLKQNISADISGLKEKDCGGSSGWMYKVNSETPMTASDKYFISPDDVIIFYYVIKYGDTV